MQNMNIAIGLNNNMAYIVPPSLCQTEDLGSENLRRLAKQLQFYKPPKPIDEVEENIEHGINDVPSSVKMRERRAAVLICLFEDPEDELRVILTRRSMNLASHPGGKMEEGDEDESATALREAMEEIGLDSSLVQVVAQLEFFLSQHLLTVVPVIGLVSRIEDFKPLLNADEVDAIFDVPLEMFLKKENHRFEDREWRGWKYVVHHFDFESEQGEFLIWGLTASILIRAASVIYQQSPFFQAHLPDFQTLQRALHSVDSNVA
ncbi:nudix hydrolase 15, mitochondrial isoform X2 [Rosa chinensis]|uniref:nudix hydrolase 15, mitochondrial isoform X2 n=1 Tax=Rosa chinensis TaxID=74649 RepID=UPI001AD901CB|nr:nudix hydrolase 15, mitochondrial isoform X2 [Rosa chinensis]